jgi:rfaE bifunctional protein nucleotidyltransferase chain/domain
VLVSDYGRGLTADAGLRAALADGAGAVVWDPHPRGSGPVAGVRLATPNLSEALRLSGRGRDGTTVAAAAGAGRELVRRWRAAGVAVTLGPDGAVLTGAGEVPVAVPAPMRSDGDPCGAGDRFAATVAVMLATGALPSEAVTAAVTAASAYVAGGGPATLAATGPAPARPGTAADVIARTRAAGGTVVATGGCFDLLHAGHVAALEAARRLGDCLVVCVNSDASVRRLKGAGRPLSPAADRVRVLQALGAVDAVVVFDEDTPLAVLDTLRPDVWVKGGDYTVDALPETGLLASWGGEVVVVPYLAGRSTTRLVQTAATTTVGRQDD